MTVQFSYRLLSQQGGLNRKEEQIIGHIEQKYLLLLWIDESNNCKINLPTLVLVSPNTLFVVLETLLTVAEGIDTWLLDLLILPLSAFVAIGNGVFVDVDDVSANSVVVVAMDKGWDEGNWLLLSLVVVAVVVGLVSFIELVPMTLAASTNKSVNNHMNISFPPNMQQHRLHQRLWWDEVFLYYSKFYNIIVYFT